MVMVGFTSYGDSTQQRLNPDQMIPGHPLLDMLPEIQQNEWSPEFKRQRKAHQRKLTGRLYE